MAHLRFDFPFQVDRAAFAAWVQQATGKTLRDQLQTASFHLQADTPDGRFHLQVYASGIDTTAGAPDSPEGLLYRMIPDADVARALAARQDPNEISLIFRACGEMTGSRDAPVHAPGTSWIDLASAGRPRRGLRPCPRLRALRRPGGGANLAADARRLRGARDRDGRPRHRAARSARGRQHLARLRDAVHRRRPGSLGHRHLGALPSHRQRRLRRPGAVPDRRLGEPGADRALPGPQGGRDDRRPPRQRTRPGRRRDRRREGRGLRLSARGRRRPANGCRTTRA